MATTVNIGRDAGAPVTTSTTSKRLAVSVDVSRVIVVSTASEARGW
ncbi:MAG TPA: hypothetical protein VK923_05410 [Euzebyales bacterium]|nr:hypothetical protein [Euzebyales bacterium]